MKGISLLDDDALALAAEIERQYIPLPRYEDGEPVRLGCAVCGGIVGGFSVWDDGAFTTYDKDGNVLQDGDPGDFVKRPESKALDVDGVETKAGDTVWLHDKVDGGPVGEPMKVAEVLCDGTLVFEGGGAMPARLVTHREPDSLEKPRDRRPPHRPHRDGRMMNEVVFEISGSIYVSDETLEYYKDDGEIDLQELVNDSVGLDKTGEFVVTEAYFV